VTRREKREKPLRLEELNLIPLLKSTLSLMLPDINYVPNMIMGAALADIGGLVISARKGEFEAVFEKDGQTREHAQLAKSLGV